MKSSLLIWLFFISFGAFSSVKVTVSDGSWFDPAVWSPSGVPLMEDTIVINHNISITGNFVDFGANWFIVNSSASIVGDTIFSLHGNLKVHGLMDMRIIAIGDGDSTLVFGNVYGRKYIPGNPNNINYGNILSDSLILGDSFDNYSNIDVDMLVAGGPSLVNHMGSIMSVASMGTLGGPATNELNASMFFGSLITSENMVNDGNVSCDNWTHAQGIVDGSTGRFCISDCFVNISTINGTVDICDMTTTFCDMNLGTIAGTVTSCAAGSCNNSIDIDESEHTFSISPNPTENNLVIRSYSDVNYRIVNCRGENMCQGIVHGEKIQNISNYPSGVYFIISTEKVVKFVKL